MVVNSTVDTKLVLDKSVFRFQRLKRFGQLVHGISRRRAPDLTEARELNLRADASEGGEHAAGHRGLLCDAMGMDLAQTVWFDPVEAGPVVKVTREHCGSGGRDWETRVRGARGLITDETEVFLCTLFNDNVVALLFDPRWYAVGLVSVDPEEKNLESLEEAVALMESAYGTQRDELTAFLGPSLGPCCYVFPDPALPHAHSRTNLWDVVRGTLHSVGLDRKRILNPRLCTGCKPFDFYSRHTDGAGAAAGAMVVGISDRGDFSESLARRRANLAQRGPRREDAALKEISLSIEENRLNKEMKCPHGRNKVYIRSLLDGTTDQTGEPEIALRCPIMAHVGLLAEGYNILDKDYIEAYCCGDYEECEAYQKFLIEQRRHR